MNEFFIPLQNDAMTYSFVHEIRRTNSNPGPMRLHRVPFGTNPILLHRVPLSLMTFSSSPILLLRVPFSYSDKINKFLILLQYDPTKYSFVNQKSQTNFSTGPLRRHRVLFSTSPILLHRVPLTAGWLQICCKI